MTFDWHVNLGEMIAAFGIIVTVFTMNKQNTERIKGIETKLEMMFEWFQSRVINREGGDPFK